MYSNYTIIIDERELHEDYICNIFRDILSGPKSTLNNFIEIRNNYWDAVTEVPSPEIIYNATEKYNNMLASKYWTKTDPKDGKTLALSTHMSKLEKDKAFVLETLKGRGINITQTRTYTK